MGKQNFTKGLESYDELLIRKRLCDRFIGFREEISEKNPPDYYITSWDVINPVLRKFDTVDVSKFAKSEQATYSQICDTIDKQMSLYDIIPEKVFILVSDGISWYKGISESIEKPIAEKLPIHFHTHHILDIINFKNSHKHVIIDEKAYYNILAILSREGYSIKR